LKSDPKFQDIDPFLCTHLVYGFAGLDKTRYVIKSLDEYNDLEENWGKGSFRKFTNLKNVNPNLKTLLAIGGWNEGEFLFIIWNLRLVCKTFRPI
jgi:chitinase